MSVCVAALAAFATLAQGFKISPLASSLRNSKISSAVTRPSVGKVRATATESRFITEHPNNNVTPYIEALVGRDLHNTQNHPLNTIKKTIEEYFATLGTDFEICDSMDPLVNTQQCFDDLRIEPDHVSRRPSDTYYVTDTTLLRTHTSAHQSELLRAGKEAFLCTGDVYRRDEIDSTHFPAFHQMEGVKLFPESEMPGELSREEWLASPECKKVADDLKATLEGMVDKIFGKVEKRWIDEYFPFTEPSFELEIFYKGDWMEVLGCGVIHSEVLDNCGLSHRHGWAFGLGLERLAMVLFSIPDIRLFWTSDERFHKQFKSGEIITFKPYSKYPPVFKDVSMWIPDNFEENDFMEVVREGAGELVEEVKLIDEFENVKKGLKSKCYRITYRSMERSLTDEEINKLYFDLRDEVPDKLGVTCR